MHRTKSHPASFMIIRYLSIQYNCVHTEKKSVTTFISLWLYQAPLSPHNITRSMHWVPTWTPRALFSISSVQRRTTKGTESWLSLGSRDNSIPKMKPLLCSHSTWHTSRHFLWTARPHWQERSNRQSAIFWPLHREKLSGSFLLWTSQLAA